MLNKETKAIADAINNELDIPVFFRKLQNLHQDNGLNDRKNRAGKGTLIEKLLPSCSNKITHADQTGYDVIFDYNGINLKIEVKFLTSCMFTKKRKDERSITSEIKYKNTLGANKITILCDYLLIIDMHGMGLVDTNTIKSNYKIVSDGVTVRFPNEDIAFIAKPGNYDVLNPISTSKWSEKIDKLMDEHIEAI